jgi:hypothetical protein
MNLFWQLNRNKLKSVFLLCSLAFLCAVSVLLAFTYHYNQFPDLNLLIRILIFAGLVLPVFCISVSIIAWTLDNKRYLKIISKSSLKELENYGYRYSKINEDSKWFYTSQKLSKNVNGFDIKLEIIKDTISFSLFAFHKGIEELRYNELKKKIKNLNFNVFFVGNFIREVNIKNLNDLKIYDLEDDFEELTQLLLKYGYTSN